METIILAIAALAERHCDLDQYNSAGSFVIPQDNDTGTVHAFKLVQPVMHKAGTVIGSIDENTDAFGFNR